MDLLLQAIPVLPFDAAAAEAYGNLVAQAGYSRRKLLDHMIAAQALSLQETLATRKSSDFAGAPGLQVETW